VQLVGCSSSFSRSDCYAVTFCCEGASYALADVGACTEDEDDGRCAWDGGVVWLCLIGLVVDSIGFVRIVSYWRKGKAVVLFLFLFLFLFL
jgi:hypothetical protein